MKKKIIYSGLGVLCLVAVVYFVLIRSSPADAGPLARVTVKKGSIVEKALAVGTVEPENEISVKSKVSGVVKKIFADAGTFVRAGDPLLEVRPDPTPLELAEAKRQVQMRDNDMQTLEKERVRQESMRQKGLSSPKEYEDFQRTYEEAQLQMSLSRERLELLESGRVTIENTEIESIIKAPIAGFVLKKMVEVGDPVTPLTSFTEGTVLMKMANMQRLIFKGTVDEIDVGKLREGMYAELKVGAIPNDTIAGALTKISLKAEKKENAAVFPVEILIPATSNSVLRAGYSANANIIIQKKDSILLIPERVVTFRNDSAFVKVPGAGGKEEERCVKTGLSDAINIEILAGLTEGEEVFEKPVKKIE